MTGLMRVIRVPITSRRTSDENENREELSDEESGWDHADTERAAAEYEQDPGCHGSEPAADGVGVENAPRVEQAHVKGAHGRGHRTERHDEHEFEHELARGRCRPDNGGDPAHDESDHARKREGVPQEGARDAWEAIGLVESDLDEDGDRARILKSARQDGCDEYEIRGEEVIQIRLGAASEPGGQKKWEERLASTEYHLEWEQKQSRSGDARRLDDVRRMQRLGHGARDRFR
jgi:hypothetical protein